MYDYILISASSLVAYSCYVQFSPTIGNVWYRSDSENVKRFQLSGLLSLLNRPLNDNLFWKYKNWDLNWYIYLIGFNSIYYITKNYLVCL